MHRLRNERHGECRWYGVVRWVLLLLVGIHVLVDVDGGGVRAHESDVAATADRVYQRLRDLYMQGDYVKMEATAQRMIDSHPEVLQDHRHPSPYQYLGVAQYGLGNLTQATESFQKAVRVNPDDVASWVNIGGAFLSQMQLAQAARTLEIVVHDKKATEYTHLLFKARNWMGDWRDRDEMLQEVERRVMDQLRGEQSTELFALDFAELPASISLAINRRMLSVPVDRNQCCRFDSHVLELKEPRLRVGFVSSDFGVHPVAQLIRGLLAMMTHDRDDVQVFAFSLMKAQSWWKRNITRSIDYMVSLHGRSPSDSARIIRAHGIHVLIDLNGHTLHSGLPIFCHRPAPAQISFLGHPMTTGSDCIDWVITDAVSTPVETVREHFTEHMLVLPHHYIVNDYMQLLGHTIVGDRPSLESSLDPVQQDFAKDAFVFATFSNWQKMDPPIFGAWMSILAQVPHSVLWMMRYSGHLDATRNLRQEAQAYGIDGDRRLVFSDLMPWINHTMYKRAADLILDTSLKNGHTTILDGLFAGVPVVTLEGARMSNRAGSSALHALGLGQLVVSSYKEYVNVAVTLATHPNLLRQLRMRVETRRNKYPLFNTALYTSRFTAAIKSAWFSAKMHFRTHTDANATRAFHFLSPTAFDAPMTPQKIDIHSALHDTNMDDEFDALAQKAVNSGELILLHVGGQAKREGWSIVDVEEREEVDYVMKMDNLYTFPDSSVTALYASHVLEHTHFGFDNGVERTLAEWFRVLRPGGALYVAVPDLAILSSLFINETLSEQERFFVMKMMFGAQVNEHDVHKVGFNYHFLASFLTSAGFCDLERVESFGLFHDSSLITFKGTPISLNVMARACKAGDWVGITAPVTQYPPPEALLVRPE